jgi:hypothetical protein
MLIVERHYSGNRQYVTFTAAPDSTFVPRGLLDKPQAELTRDERMVLLAHKQLISAARPASYVRNGLNPARLEAAIVSLVSKKLLTRNRAGSSMATIEGKNVARTLPEAGSFY